MRLRNPRVWIAVASGAAVLYVVVGYVGRTSPGPLASVHARDPELQGFQSCSQCHGGWFGSMTDACIECHDDIGGQMESRSGLHGAVAREKARDCAACHSEHHGAEFRMVNRQSFAQAGVRDPLEFDHTMIGWVMDGKHLELACAECHENADVDVLPPGGKRFMGLAKDCAGCHEDPHEGRMILACAQCHGQGAWDELHSIGHDEHLPLTGGHEIGGAAEVGCRTCHEKETPNSLERLGEGRAVTTRQCADCHESPHAESFVASVAQVGRTTAPAACVRCHLHEHVSFTDERLVVTAEHHACSGFRLEPPHHEVECARCHAGESFQARYPGRDADTCRACHEDPHGEQFGALRCLDCHERRHFEPHAFTVRKHEETALALDGSHLEAECHACHVVVRESEPREFRGTPSDCDECHSDAHRGFFAPFAAELAETEHGACARCHRTTTFSELAVEFDHARWTSFPLRGAHLQDGCEICHERAEEPDRFRRSFGFVDDFRGCVTCHEDPHRGMFERAELGDAVDGRTGCARCHGETSFRAMPYGFDHGAWTGFSLSGAHKEVGCAECHRPLRRPDEQGRTTAWARGSRCEDCHADPHAGQFEERGRTDCAGCHRAGASFEDLSFNHNIDSRFPLDGSHVDVACDRCHEPFERDGVEIVRYKPLGTECSDCHGTQKNPFRRRPK